uniref:Uncharacterized protein n=1 Tax=Physcomitrium patens TaxID=3218 RepID=A0A2K1JH78_PHYPA|nr:hypothetical protein PHYPA_018314 [Physcomitrium patens]
MTRTLRKNLKDLRQQFPILRHNMMQEYKETGTALRRAIREQGRGQSVDTIKEIQERDDAEKQHKEEPS